jgi:hypothetical protein
MRLIKLGFFLFVLAACAATPSLVSFFAGDGVIQYFLPPTNWTARNSKAALDITYRTNSDMLPFINITFFGGRNMPRGIGSVSLHGDGIDYPLENISVLFANVDRNELRITSTGDRDALIALLNSEPITLRAEFDGIEHIYTPDKRFINLKNKFLIAASF